ncbi:hypothetical protein SH2C18_35990 [Clostridium sediminicola]|uniref:EAL domain-containing protein n=1 Tax=Clostridium sediminicola TaxID=3114879 RepID=UPI0031F21EE8
MSTTNKSENASVNSYGENEIYISDLFDNHKFIMIVIDCENGNIVNANKKAISYYGYTKKEILKLRIQDINILKEEEVNEEMRKARIEKRNFFYFRHKLANGEVRDVEVYSAPIKIENKAFLHTIIFDVNDNRLSKTYYDQIFMNTPLATVILDDDNNIVNSNTSFEKLFQHEKHNIINRNLKDVISNSSLEKSIEEYLEIDKKEILLSENIKVVKNSGDKIIVNITIFPIMNYGKQLGRVVTFVDINDRIKKEEELKLFEQVLANNTEGIIITDSDGNIEWVNSIFTKITGYTQSEVKKQNARIFKSEKYENEFYENIWNIIKEEGNWQGEIKNKNKNGDCYPLFLNVCSIKGKEEKISHYIGIFSDITESKIKEKTIWDLAYKDSLTKLYNRVYFMDKLDEKIKICGNNKLAVLFIDLDDFKRINDSLGHSVGDRVLQIVATRILKCIREKDVVARIGGDEFTVLIPSLRGQNEVVKIANRIINGLSRSAINIDNNRLYISASIGIAIYPENGINSEEIMKTADIAMYKSKEDKSNYEKRLIFFDENMKNDIEEEFNLSNYLVNSIDKEELYLEYQPILDIKTEKITGAEALVRWQHPKLGRISPDKFIPIAEKNGMINRIGEWVLKTACMQNKQWQIKGERPIFISVNVSVAQLKQGNFLKLVKDTLSETDLEAKYLELEITESISTENIDAIKNTLTSIHNLGVNITIDDFGTGYSSLGELSDLSISKLKIDKKFIIDMDTKSKNKQISSAIIAIGKSLDIKVVAEGIETKSQLDFLKKNNCDFGQGYLFSKPVDSDLFIKLML